MHICIGSGIKQAWMAFCFSASLIDPIKDSLVGHALNATMKFMPLKNLYDNNVIVITV